MNFLFLTLFALQSMLCHGQIILMADTVKSLNQRMVNEDDEGRSVNQGVHRYEGEFYFDLLKNKNLRNVYRGCLNSSTLSFATCVWTYETYDNGVLNGPIQQYNQTGDLIAASHLKNGRLHGLTYIFCSVNEYPYSFNPSSNPQILIEYRNGKRKRSYYLAKDSGQILSSSKSFWFIKLKKNWKYDEF